MHLKSSPRRALGPSRAEESGFAGEPLSCARVLPSEHLLLLLRRGAKLTTRLNSTGATEASTATAPTDWETLREDDREEGLTLAPLDLFSAEFKRGLLCSIVHLPDVRSITHRVLLGERFSSLRW